MSEVFTISTLLGGITSCSFMHYYFDNSSGLLSNYMFDGGFTAPLGNAWAYGTEFSPDGSKLYYTYHGYIMQYNACQTPTVINGSLGYEEGNSVTYNRASMQLGSNGKIYIAKAASNTLDVINYPNLPGLACGYSVNAVSTGSGTVQYGLPSFLTSYFEQMPSPFTYSTNFVQGCMNYAFTTPSICPFSGYTVLTTSWNFGDPTSGASNVSLLSSPSHSFSSPGTYTVRLISTYACNRNDTLYQVLSVGSPSFSLLTPSLSCVPISASIITSGGVGPFSYTWSPTQQTTAIANGLSPGTYSVAIIDNGSGCAGNFTVSVPSVVFSSSVLTNGLPCYGQGGGSASITAIGGSGTYSYTWSNANTNTVSASGLAAGIYSVIIYDLLSQCSTTNVFTISQPAALSLAMVVLTSTACVSNSIILYSGANGGTPPLTYSWSGGPAGLNYTVSEQNPGIYTYSCTSTDAHNCSVTNTISVTFVANPTLSVFGATICPGAIASISASGATNYSWMPGSFPGNSVTLSPSASLIFTVTGSTASCSNSATTSVIVLSPPTITITSNSPLCSGTSLNLFGSGGGNYSWAGPSNFSSLGQNIVIPASGLSNGGVYSLVVTGLNSCTATASTNVVINASPLLTITGNTIICVGQSTQLHAAGATTYTWSTGSNNPVLFVNPVTTTSFTLMGTNLSNGCSSTSTINIKVVECLTVQETSGTMGKIKLYPNPLQSLLYIETDMATHVTIYSESGALILDTDIITGLNTLDLQKYASGIYFVRVHQDKTETVYKVIKSD